MGLVPFDKGVNGLHPFVKGGNFLHPFAPARSMAVKKGEIRGKGQK